MQGYVMDERELNELILLVRDDLDGPTATHQLLHYIYLLANGESLEPLLQSALEDLAAYSRIKNTIGA